jgi:hypothetical protein
MRLWGLEDAADAEDTVELFCRYGLASGEVRNGQQWIKFARPDVGVLL